MWQKLKCLIWLHSWRIADEINVPGSGYTDHPMDFYSGGIDYVIQCAHCSAAWVARKRSVWIKPPYPPLKAAESQAK